MKRLLAILLALISLLSLSSGIVSAEEATVGQIMADDVEIKPFYALAWDQIDEREQDYVTEFVFLDVMVKDGELVLATAGAEKNDLDAIADKMVKKLNSRPEGMRYLCLPGVNQVMANNPKAIIYVDKEMDKLKAQFTTLIKKIYDRGGMVEGLFTDLEHTAMNSWYIYAQGYGGTSNNKNIYNDIVNHPNYATDVRPLLEERNFQFYTEVGGEKSEIWSICYKKAETSEVNQCIWDAAMRIRLSRYLTDALYEPMIAYYPDAIMSDYQASDTYGWMKDLADDAGRPIYLGGNREKAGNSSNLNFYGGRPGLNYFENETTKQAMYNNPAAYNKAVYEQDAYNGFQWDVKKVKEILMAAEGGIVNFWISGYNVIYPAYREDTFINTPYYSEMSFHIGMANPQPFLLYIYKGEFETDKKYNIAVKIVAQLMEELTRVVGAADREPIQYPFSWNDGYMLSGMYAGGRNVWRITPDITDGMTLENFKVEGTDPTFSINGKTVTFPQGKIIETAKIDKIGSCGYWVETPKDVMPVVTADADRYEQFPAFLEDFQGYEADTQFTSKTALPASCWVVAAKSGSATVQKENGKNQVLAIDGTVSLENVKLPQNVTAGDSYAKQQANQVTVTLPETLNAEAELKLLAVSYQDGGIQVSGGKAYYVAGGERKALADVPAGGKYVFKREFDLRNEGAYTCDYYVYDAKGKLLGEAKGVALELASLPISGVTMEGKDIKGGAVLLDDFKMYMTGFAGDFEIYDAKGGVIAPEADKARSADTAYRYSWANASDKIKNMSVVAAYYDENDKLLTEEVVKTLRLVPGNDGVETGIVELADKGAKVLVFLKAGEDEDLDVGDTPNTGNDEPDEPDEPTNPGGTTAPGDATVMPGKDGGNNGVIILIAAVAVAVIALSVAIFYPTKKKPQANGGTAEATEDTAEAGTQASEPADETDEDTDISFDSL